MVFKRLSRADFPSSPPLRRVSNELFSVALWPLRQKTEILYTCVVSKKTLRGAVDRNRLKRRCREAFRTCAIPFRGPCAIVVDPKRAALEVSFEDMRASLASLLGKLET